MEEHASGGGFWASLKKILIVVGVLGFAYILMDQMGLKVLDKTEEVRIDSRPETPQRDWEAFKARKEEKRAEARKREEEAEALLEQFIEDYRKTGNRDLREADIRFLEEADKKAKKRNLTDDAAKYYDFMQKSYDTYQGLRRLSGSDSLGEE